MEHQIVCVHGLRRSLRINLPAGFVGQNMPITVKVACPIHYFSIIPGIALLRLRALVCKFLQKIFFSRPLHPDKMVLYHGSKSGIQGKIKPASRDRCDFGAGFYMGTDPLQPLTLICDYEQSVFYILSVDLHSLKTLDVPADIEWAMLVAYHRGRMEAARGTKFFQKYQELDKGYDMVIGSIANDRMFYVLDSFFEGTITDTALVKSLSALKLGRQYVAITQKACDAVKIEREVQLLWMERQALKKSSEQNRSNGIAFANQICKEYRREGRFFDEILDGAKQRR